MSTPRSVGKGFRLLGGRLWLYLLGSAHSIMGFEALSSSMLTCSGLPGLCLGTRPLSLMFQSPFPALRGLMTVLSQIYL